MNIEMINGQSANRMMDVEKNQYSNHSNVTSRMSTQGMGYSLDITGKVMENAAYGKEELKSAMDIAQEASMKNVTLERNYKAVMSNSMSDEDFAKLCEDGVNPTNTTVEESVTNLDKIKIAMAQSGVVVEGYNDDISREEIQAVVGSASIASAIEASLVSANLPDTKENIEKMTTAFSEAMAITPLSDEAVKYMINNEMEPTIDNLYKAEHSSNDMINLNSQKVIYSGANTYASKDSVDSVWEELIGQAENVVAEAGIQNKEDGLKDAKWLVENQVPLTTDNLVKYEELKSINLPAVQDDVIKSMTVALEEGLEPKDADLTKTESIYDKAVNLVSEFANMPDNGDLTRRRQLEEIRLVMTAEANLTLLRKGIQVETEPLEELVGKLKEAEREFYKPILESEPVKNQETNFVQDEKTVESDNHSKIERSLDEKIDLYKATRRIIDELPDIPVKSVADIIYNTDNNSDSSGASDFTLQGLSDIARINASAYRKANESYEALMTAPRQDMGDSIKKAFSNVDDILTDLNMDLNEHNRKAVRTLGYASMPINRESIDEIREATMVVEKVASLMTPAKTLKMIRDGYNPLDVNMYELEDELSVETVEETGEKYSQFLWNLERKGEISEDEKSAYIGMYRLLHQIEKQDGRVIGNVLSNGQELTMANMLAASRSNKHKNMDVKIDDDFGVLDDLITKSDSILDQIEKGFVQLIDSKVTKDYAKERLDEARVYLKSSKEAEDVLEKIEEPVTIENIMVASEMLSGSRKTVRKLFNEKDTGDNEGKLGEVKLNYDRMTDSDVEELVNDFDNKESTEAAYEKYVEKALEISEKRLENADTYIEARDWMMVHKSLSLGSSLAKKDSYDIPVKTENGYTSIHLVIEHGGANSGRVSASFDSEEYGKVDAKFSLREDGVDGFIVSDSRYGIDNLKKCEEALVNGFSKEGMNTSNLSFVYSRSMQKTNYFPNSGDVNATNNQLYKIAKAFITSVRDNS